MTGRHNLYSGPEDMLAEADEDSPSITTFTLARPGQRALRFRGRLLAGAQGRPPAPSSAAALWHDINVYQTKAGRFVVEVIARRPGAGDVAHVESFPELGAASSWLESFQPETDITPETMAQADQPELADVLLHGLMLRLHRSRVDGRFRDLVSDVLWRLEAAVSGGSPQYRPQQSDPTAAMVGVTRRIG
jgi:hypothetical protein